MIIPIIEVVEETESVVGQVNVPDEIYRHYDTWRKLRISITDGYKKYSKDWSDTNKKISKARESALAEYEKKNPKPVAKKRPRLPINFFLLPKNKAKEIKLAYDEDLKLWKEDIKLTKELLLQWDNERTTYLIDAMDKVVVKYPKLQDYMPNGATFESSESIYIYGDAN